MRLRGVVLPLLLSLGWGVAKPKLQAQALTSTEGTDIAWLAAKRDTLVKRGGGCVETQVKPANPDTIQRTYKQVGEVHQRRLANGAWLCEGTMAFGTQPQSEKVSRYLRVFVPTPTGEFQETAFWDAGETEGDCLVLQAGTAENAYRAHTFFSEPGMHLQYLKYETNICDPNIKSFPNNGDSWVETNPPIAAR